ncbi:MAG: AmmeMemoRadiSam system protein A [Desulfarculaceae bacterium]|nr:AmmeMemoRadiSam system protein A [Desulfarculaceae bacterium]
MEDEFTEQQGALLLKLARMSIARKLGIEKGKKDSDFRKKAFSDAPFAKKRGVFVTLLMDGKLRGCIGNLEPDGTVVEGVRHNALNAAFEDPRFPPLEQEELDRVQIEVSILTKPVPLEYTDKEDLVSKITPYSDGLIIGKGSKKATFLPQVWEQVSEPEEFLSHLCRKAGLPADQWKKGDLEVRVYRVESFEEQGNT